MLQHVPWLHIAFKTAKHQDPSSWNPSSLPLTHLPLLPWTPAHLKLLPPPGLSSSPPLLPPSPALSYSVFLSSHWCCFNRGSFFLTCQPLGWARCPSKRLPQHPELSSITSITVPSICRCLFNCLSCYMGSSVVSGPRLSHPLGLSFSRECEPQRRNKWTQLSSGIW